jgi:hypothetical protein
VLVLVLALAAVLAMWAGRGVAFIGDEWAWLFGGLHVNADAILRDYNGHLIATTWGLYDALLATVGFAHYWIYRAAAVVLQLVIGWLVYLLARRRLDAWSAVAPAAIVALLGTGSDVFLSVNIGILGATAACLGALVMLDRHAARADIAACLLLVIGLASFTSAVAFTAGVLAELLWHRDRWRRVWVPLLASLLYLGWRLHWGSTLVVPGVPPGDVFDVLRHGYEAAAGAFAGLGGVQLASPTLQAHAGWVGPLAQVLLALAIVLLAGVIIRAGAISARLVNLIVAALVLWLLIAVGRGSLGDPYASRYVYQGAVILVLIAVEAAAEVRVRTRALRRLVAIGVVVAAALNIGWMFVWARHLRQESTVALAQLAALDIARGSATPEFRPSTQFALSPVTAGSYFKLERKFGRSPAFTTRQLRAAPEPAREAADAVLVRSLGVKFVHGAAYESGPAPTVERAAGARVDTAGSCVILTPSVALGSIDIAQSLGAGLVFHLRRGGAALVLARRYADRYAVGVGALRDPSGLATLVTQLGAASRPWRFRVFSSGAARICSRS